jgi:hypothetical protein
MTVYRRSVTTNLVEVSVLRRGMLHHEIYVSSTQTRTLKHYYTLFRVRNEKKGAIIKCHLRWQHMVDDDLRKAKAFELKEKKVKNISIIHHFTTKWRI